MKVAQSCPTLCDPMDYTVHGILQARILEWIAIPFSRGSSQPRDWTQVPHVVGGFFTSWATREANTWEAFSYLFSSKKHSWELWEDNFDLIKTLIGRSPLLQGEITSDLCKSKFEGGIPWSSRGLRLRASTAWGTGSIPGLGTKILLACISAKRKKKKKSWRKYEEIVTVLSVLLQNGRKWDLNFRK